jgi:hypothetical protein
MRIYFKYEPDECRFWLGAKERQGNKEVSNFFQLQSWMDVEDVIHCLRGMVDKVNARNTNIS